MLLQRQVGKQSRRAMTMKLRMTARATGAASQVLQVVLQSERMKPASAITSFECRV